MLRRGSAVILYCVRLHPRPFAIAVTGAVIVAVATVGTAWAIGQAVDRVIVPRFEDGDVGAGTVAAIALLIVGIGLTKAAGIVCRRAFAVITRARAEATIREQVVEHYQRLPYEYHRRTPAGRLLAHAGADVEAATDILNPLPFSTGVVVLVLAAAGWMFATDPFLALLGLVLIPGLTLFNVVYQRTVEGPATVAQERVGRVSAAAHESFDGALLIKVLGAEDAETERFGAEAEDLRDAKVNVARIRATFDALLDALPTTAIMIVIVLGAWRIDAGAITVGTLVSFITLFNLLAWPLRIIGYVLGDLPRAVVGFDRVRGVLAEPVDDHVPAPRSTGIAAPLPLSIPEGTPVGLEVERVTFAHDGGVPVLTDVSLGLAPGSTTALVGPTGSGKSTLLLLVARLLRPTAGSIRVGGADIGSLDTETVAGTVGMVFQEAFLFGASVTENLVLGGDADHELLEWAARVAGAHEFIVRLPHSWDTVLGERGATLSGGQRQRLALARALVRRPRLLLLDDATSSVDPTTEAAILDGLRRHMTATTVLVVATRPATLALAERVLFLADGRVRAGGTHEELLGSYPPYEQLVRAYEHEREHK